MAASARIYLGDSHNFGARVYLESGTIIKPRCIAWEYLFLSQDSPVRLSIEKYALQNGLHNPLALFPKLQFTQCHNERDFATAGSVQQCNILPPTPDAFNVHTFEDIGRSIGAMTWFGMSDLHTDNMIIGTQYDGSPIVGPIDIESLFHNYDLISQSLLIPSMHCSRSFCGLSSLLDFQLEYPNADHMPALCYGFLDALNFFDNYQEDLNALLIDSNLLHNAPVRVLPRHTRDYYTALNSNVPSNLQQSLCDSELAQLQRNDIPYFFRYLSTTDIFYHDSPNTIAEAMLPAELNQKASPYPRLARNGSIDERYTSILRKAGTIQLARLFDNGMAHSSQQYHDLKICFDRHHLFIRNDRDLAVQCQRNTT